MKSASLRISALVLAFGVGGAAVAVAQDSEYGTTASPTFNPSAFNQPAFNPSQLAHPFDLLGPPPLSWKNASYATGGVALRNRGAGNISVSGFVGPLKAAYIYWAVIEPNASGGTIRLQRLFPTVSGVTTLVGAAVGVGPQPCWIGNTITVYRAAIPPGLATGNGSYQVTLLAGAGGSTTGGDPWVAPRVLPLWEGASIVMIGNGTGTVNLFDVGLAGMTFFPPYSYTLTLTGLISPGGAVLWANIGADGQVGSSRAATDGASGETTTINGVLVAGPGSLQNLTGDWNGSSGFPLPQLWDDTGHAFANSAATPTNTLSITFGPATGQADCLTPVANVV